MTLKNEFVRNKISQLQGPKPETRMQVLAAMRRHGGHLGVQLNGVGALRLLSCEGGFGPPLVHPNPGSRSMIPESRIPNPESRIKNPESRITNPESRIPNLESRIPNPETQKVFNLLEPRMNR
jgi:hypothetical protein